MRRIGIFGGSFDPPHNGHYGVASWIASHGGVDEVWLMPGAKNPLKPKGPFASECDRAEMCALTVGDVANIKVCLIEFSMPKPSYTYRTLCALRRQNPDCEFVLIIGSDNFLTINRWKDWNKLMGEFEIIVYGRPGAALSGDGKALSEYDGIDAKGVSFLQDVPRYPVSSTDIRQRIAEGKPIDAYVVPKVGDYIRRKQLYNLTQYE